MSYPSFGEWKESLPSELRSLVERQIEELRQLGCPDPEPTVRSEVSENFPQRAKFVLLRKIWAQAIDRWRDGVAPPIGDILVERETAPGGYFDDGLAAERRMKAAGISEWEIASFARMVAYETAFSIAYTLDYGCDENVPRHMPGWGVFETDQDGNSTGRGMSALHESILGADPSGREGRVR